MADEFQIREHRVDLTSEYATGIINSLNYLQGRDSYMYFYTPIEGIPASIIDNAIYPYKLYFTANRTTTHAPQVYVYTNLYTATGNSMIDFGTSLNISTTGIKTHVKVSEGYINLIPFKSPIAHKLHLKIGQSNGDPLNSVSIYTDKAEQQYRPYITLSYKVKLPTVTNLAPSDAMLVSPKSPITLSWKHTSFESGIQKSFQLKYSTDDGQNWTTINETTSRGSYTFPLNHFPNNAKVLWKVKTIDSTSNVESSYGNASFNISSNTPYLTGLTPNGGVINARNSIVLNWVHNSNMGGIQKSFQLKYSTDDGQNWTTINETTSRNNYTFMGNFFAGQLTVDWRVKTIDSVLHNESDFASARFTTGDTAQRSPIIIKPFGVYLDVSDEISFEWAFMGQPGEFQSKYEVNWSSDDGANWNSTIVESLEESHLVPSNTFSTGTVIWRVKTYNNYDEVSPWSDIKPIYMIGKPDTPIIFEVSNKSKPLVKWNSNGQQQYELEIVKDQVVIYSSGIISSISAMRHQVEKHLDDGDYKVRLRIKNRYDLWSLYGEKVFIVSTTKPLAPGILIENNRYGVTILGTGLSVRSFVYRDGTLVSELLGNKFTDYTGVNNKEYAYFVRTIDADDNFSDSISKIGKCSFKGNTLALENNPSDFLLLRYNLNSKPTKSLEIGVIGSSLKFDGRDFQTFEYSDMKIYSKKLGFSIDESDFKIAEELVYSGSTMLYRDHFGENIYGTVEKVNMNKMLLGYSLEFTINKVKEV